MKYIIFAILLVFCSTSCGEKKGPPKDMALPIIPAVAQSQFLSHTISVVGNINANERVELESKIEGTVEGVFFDEGQLVETGKELFKIDEKKLKAIYEESLARFNLAKANIARSEQLFKSKTISSQEYDQAVSSFDATKAELERRRQELDDAIVVAPFSGIIGSRLVSPGQRVNMGTPLSSLVDLNPVKVEFYIPERFSQDLKPGLEIELAVNAYPDSKRKGNIYFVSPFIDNQTRSVLVKAQIPNDDHKLKPGMFAQISLTLSKNQSITIPESALMLNRDEVKVFLITRENTIEVRQVTVGLRQEGIVEILSGLSVGDTVVIEGHQKLGPGSKVTFNPDKKVNAPTKETE